MNIYFIKFVCYQVCNNKLEKCNKSNFSKNYSYPDWFLEESISELEIIHIGEKIINDRLNYSGIRNSIINLYKNNPNVYLTGIRNIISKE
jgi:hypothetical protein